MPGRDQNPAARKRELRRELRARLAGVGRDQGAAAAARVTDRVLALPELAGAGGVLACLSFGDEIDTWKLVERLLQRGHTVYVPRADRRDRALHVHRYPCALETLSFGLRQPPRETPELPAETIDSALGVVLLPGLAFDRRGTRLGSGAGYFDRFLKRHPVPAVGLGYAFQLVDELPAEPHDVPLAAVVTEAGVWRRRSS